MDRAFNDVAFADEVFRVPAFWAPGRALSAEARSAAALRWAALGADPAAVFADVAFVAAGLVSGFGALPVAFAAGLVVVLAAVFDVDAGPVLRVVVFAKVVLPMVRRCACFAASLVRRLVSTASLPDYLGRVRLL